MNLENASVLITGGTSGIGRAIAESLTTAGARVAVTGRDAGRLEEAAGAFGALPIRADVTNESEVKRTYQEVFEAFGHLDILVNNAGYGLFSPLVNVDRAQFDTILRDRALEELSGAVGAGSQESALLKHDNEQEW